jgi:ABC-type lipoprotein export system ATPase subunit
MPATVIAEQAGTAPVLTARGLYHIYREGEMRTAALRGADLTLEPGSWTTVMGPSGSGKSTLLHALAGVLEPSAGSVSIDGEDVTRLRPADRARWRRRRVGVVLQRDNLHPLLDLAENVALPLRLDRRGEHGIRWRVAELLQLVGLAHRAGHRVASLSGGEGQRAALAVALATRPRVLLADEPTGELDEVTAGGILDLLDGLVRDDRLALLTVTHSAQVSERADRRLTMHDGRVLHER